LGTDLVSDSWYKHLLATSQPYKKPSSENSTTPQPNALPKPQDKTPASPSHQSQNIN